MATLRSACKSGRRETPSRNKFRVCADLCLKQYSEEFLTGAQSLFLFNSISASTDTGLY